MLYLDASVPAIISILICKRNEIIWRGKMVYKIEILEKKRLERGLSYTEIADQLGMHKVTVSRTLKGVTLKPRTVKLLADYLGVEMERIIQ